MAWRTINDACRAVGVTGNIGTHTLRKTWGYWAWKSGVPLPIIMEVLNHSSLTVTKRYLGITQDEINDAYMRLNLLCKGGYKLDLFLVIIIYFIVVDPFIRQRIRSKAMQKKIESLGGQVIKIKKMHKGFFTAGPFDAFKGDWIGKGYGIYKVDYILDDLPKSIYVKFFGYSRNGEWKE
ncbi:MAG: hypothetical protein K0R93_2634 [Anaerosolibacter sp.]|jgi:hypothetical protein|nr:hypothetical protein [Anaerosolibacter sp.]